MILHMPFDVLHVFHLLNFLLALYSLNPQRYLQKQDMLLSVFSYARYVTSHKNVNVVNTVALSCGWDFQFLIKLDSIFRHINLFLKIKKKVLMMLSLRFVCYALICIEVFFVNRDNCLHLFEC